MAREENVALIRENFERFGRGEGEAVYATWADDAVWHILDANKYQGTYTRDEYFGMLSTLAAEIPDYSFEVASCEGYGDELVVVHLRSSGTTPEGPINPNGGLMIYRVVDGKIAEGWAMSGGRDATTPF